MTVRTVAGWTALISGGLLVVALAGSAIVAGTVGGAGWSAFNWMVGGGPGPGHAGVFGMGPGRMSNGWAG